MFSFFGSFSQRASVDIIRVHAGACKQIPTGAGQTFYGPKNPNNQTFAQRPKPFPDTDQPFKRAFDEPFYRLFKQLNNPGANIPKQICRVPYNIQPSDKIHDLQKRMLSKMRHNLPLQPIPRLKDLLKPKPCHLDLNILHIDQRQPNTPTLHIHACIFLIHTPRAPPINFRILPLRKFHTDWRNL